MTELEECWVKLHDYVVNLYKDDIWRDAEDPEMAAKRMETLAHEHNKASPFPLTDQSVLWSIHHAEHDPIPFHAKSQMGFEIPEGHCKGFNPISNTFMPYGELSSMEIPRPPSFMDNFMLKGSLTMIHAGAGVGKTPFAMMMCKAMLDNTRFLGWGMGEQQAQNVLYLDGELPLWLLSERMKSCFQHQYKERINVFSMMSHYDNGYSPVNIMVDHQRDMLLEAILDKAPDVLVIDNRTDFFSGKEDSNDDARIFNDFLKIIRHKGTAVIMNHHDGKDGRFRGASAMVSPIDNRIHLVKNEDDEDENQVVCSLEKRRYGTPETKVIQFTYTLDIDSYGKTSLNLV